MTPLPVIFPLTAQEALLELLPDIDPAAHSSTAIERRIKGLTANASTKNIFSTLDHGTPNYVRSETCWAREIDLTAMAVWHQAYATFGDIGGTAITRRHAIVAWHTTVLNIGFIAVGHVMRFVGSNNELVTRTITALTQVGASDICIATLDSDLPVNITPAKVLPKTWAIANAAVQYVMSRQLANAALLVTNKERRALVHDFATVNSLGNINWQLPVDTQRLAFNQALSDGDSGSGIFLVIDQQLVALSHGVNPVFGPFYTAFYDAINTVLAAQGGYALSEVNVRRAVQDHGFHLNGKTSVVEPFCTIVNGYYGAALDITSAGFGIIVRGGIGAAAVDASRTDGGNQATILVRNLSGGGVVGAIMGNGTYQVNNLQVIGPRIGGWGADPEEPLRFSLTVVSDQATHNYALRALIQDLRTHGLIGT